MKLSDLIEGVKIAQDLRKQKDKAKELQSIVDLMSTYADNAVNKFHIEYYDVSRKGKKRTCSISFNPYPDSEIMKKFLKNINKKEYLEAFEKILAQKLEEKGFTNYSLSENFLNAKEPVVLRVNW